MRRFMLSFTMAAATLAACGGGSGGGDSAPDDAPTSVPTMAYNVPPALSGEQLGSIALALADFGPEYATYETIVDSELTLAIERGIDACDPAREQAALSRYGWSKGYARWFGIGGEILEQVGTNVDVYATVDGASTKIKYDTRQVRQDQLAPNGCRGVGLENIKDLGLPTVGDQSWSVRVDFSTAHVRGSTHLLTFRRDRIVATVTITRFNATDSSQALLDLAKKVDERLMTVITAPLTLVPPAPEDDPL
jgi:hypothetical protein